MSSFGGITIRAGNSRMFIFQVHLSSGLGCLLGPTSRHCRDATALWRVQRVTIAFEGEDLELVEQACRELAERARRDAEAVKGTLSSRSTRARRRDFSVWRRDSRSRGASPFLGSIPAIERTTPVMNRASCPSRAARAPGPSTYAVAWCHLLRSRHRSPARAPEFLRCPQVPSFGPSRFPRGCLRCAQP